MYKYNCNRVWKIGYIYDQVDLILPFPHSLAAVNQIQRYHTKPGKRVEMV